MKQQIKTTIVAALLVFTCSDIINAQGIQKAADPGLINFAASLAGSPYVPWIPSVISPQTTPVTAAQWHFAGNKAIVGDDGTKSRDWTYSLVSTDKKEIIACGYGASNNTSNVNQAGVIFKLDHFGKLVWERTTDTVNFIGGTLYDAYTVLWQVTKASDGYVAVGFKDHKILIVAVDENGQYIHNTPFVLDVDVTTAPDLYSSALSSIDWPNTTLNGCRANAVAVDPTTNLTANIIVGGECAMTDNTSGKNYYVATILEINTSGSAWRIDKRYFGCNNYGPSSVCGAPPGSSGGSRILKLLTKTKMGGGYDIYGCGAISGPDDHAMHCTNNLVGPVNLETYDKDVWIIKIPSDYSAITYSKSYNKATIGLNGSSGPFIDVVSSTTYPYQEVGPLTARNFDASTAGKIHDMYLGTDHLSDATVFINSDNNKNEEASDMIFAADGNIALIANVNLLGANLVNNFYMRGNELFGLSFSGVALGYTKEYEDADGFLLKIDPATGNLLKAKNVGHFSGTVFNLGIRQDLEGHYIIGGSTADKYGTYGLGGYTPSSDINLPDNINPYEENAFMVATDDNFPGTGDIWRRSFVANDFRATDVPYDCTDQNKEDCYCMLAMDLTADGGYVIGGQNDNNGDDYSITKFAPLHQELLESATSGGYYKFGGSDIPTVHTVSGTETWAGSMNVASKVVVPNGATLNITGSGTVISFAASDQIWDYMSAPSLHGGGSLGCGIVVEPGGTLNIYNATLQGLSITGEHNMWDGIVVQGNTASSVAADQGQVNITGTTAAIKDARNAIYVADNYRTYYSSAPMGSTYTGYFTGINYSSRYDGTVDYGGGIVTAANCNFLNNRNSATFQFYKHPTNSTFTGCTFNSDATGMGDICFYTDETGAILPSATHIYAWQYPSVTLRDNTLQCYTPCPVAILPYGVLSSMSGLTITKGTGSGNNFNGLSSGVYAAMSGGAANPIAITYNTFTGNTFGINAGGINYNLVIQNNTFNVPHNSAYDATGISLAGCNNYDVSKNNFLNNTTLPFFGDIGITVNNGHTYNTMIKFNTFGYIAQASIAMQTNGLDAIRGPGLQFHCNNFQNSYQDIYRTSVMKWTSTVTPTLAENQGFCGSATSPAGNQFSTWSLGGWRLYSDDPGGQVVNYNNNGTGSAFDPDPSYTYASSLYHNNGCVGFPPTLSAACPTPSDYCPGCFLIGYGTIASLTSLDALMSETSDPDAYAALQAEHDEQTADLARYYSANGSYDSAAAMLAAYKQYRDALPFYMMAEDYGGAQAMHDSLVLDNSDDSLYAWETQKEIDLYSAGGNWMDLDSASRDSLLHIVQYNKAAGYMAGAVAALIGITPITWPMPVIDTALMDSLISSIDTSVHSGERMAHGGNAPITDINKTSSPTFSIFPNPTFGNFTIKASGAGTFTLYTLLGQQLQEYSVICGQTAMQLPTNIAAGMYLGKFKPENGGKTKEVRLIYQP
jgi:hypothetical protein